MYDRFNNNTNFIQNIKLISMMIMSDTNIKINKH